MAAEPSDAENPIEAAAKRLERAIAILDSRVKELSDRAEAANGGLFGFDRAKLAQELDNSRAREKELEVAGQEASVALGRAIEGIRRALDQVEAE